MRGGAAARSGRALGAMMTGLAEVLEGPKEERTEAVAEAPGEPLEDGPFRLLLDPEHPERSVVVVRG